MKPAQSSSDCEHCADLRQRVPIRVPADLRQALRVARANVADGTIIEVPPTSPLAYEPFSSVSVDGPWADIVGYGFRCVHCGQLFSLSAETYHGSGGEWRPVVRL
jgi:hypothetical protein